MKEKPSKTSGSMAPTTLASTGLRRTGSLVNSGSKLSWFFFPFCVCVGGGEGGCGGRVTCCRLYYVYVVATHVLWLVGRLDFPAGQLVPVYVLEERLRLDLFGGCLWVTA